MLEKRYTWAEFYALMQKSNAELMVMVMGLYPDQKLQQVKCIKYIKNIGLKEAKAIVEEAYKDSVYTWIIRRDFTIVSIYKGTMAEAVTYKNEDFGNDNYTLSKLFNQTGILYTK